MLPTHVKFTELLSEFQTKLPGSFEIHWKRQYLVNNKYNLIWNEIPVNIWNDR